MHPNTVIVYCTWWTLLLASALPWDGATPTQSGDLLPNQEQNARAQVADLSPAPTPQPPNLRNLPELQRRADVSTSVELHAAGFENGLSARVVNCAKGPVNGTFPIIDTNFLVWSCCMPGDGCLPMTSCVPQASLASCAADNACAADSFVTKCNGVYPYCNNDIILGAATQPLSKFDCGTVPSTRILSATAIDGTKSTVSYIYTTWSYPPRAAYTTSLISYPPRAAYTTSLISSKPSTSTSSSSFPSTASSTSSPISPSATSESAHVPVGAIVGGTVGAFVVLAGLIIALIFLLRSRKPPFPAQTPQNTAQIAKNVQEKHFYQPQVNTPQPSVPLDSAPRPIYQQPQQPVVSEVDGRAMERYPQLP
ncbi:hypothetical protein B0J14DRAFT_687531 [Halenospora varia]|nr:hypothetical protein B0J14DRAFT_687531 [Halenospora varia]